MKILIFAALVTSLAVSTFALNLKKQPGIRIIGGREARAAEFPFTAAIHKQTSNGLFFCVGAIVGRQWIITSGSCVDGATLFSIRIGTNNLNDNNVQRLATDMYFLHPDYNVNNLDNDIGLIKLRMPITYGQYAHPISIPETDVDGSHIVHAVGWGQTSDDGSGLVDKLRTVELTALTNEECKLYFGNQITDNMVCVGGNFNEGTCLGDTGGPLVRYDNYESVIVGVSSFISGNGCESSDPSGYTRTFPYLDWIANITTTQ